MKVLAINGSPRRHKNTGQLLEKTLEGAASAQAETELIHLYHLKYTGCISCFQCKLIGGPSYGRCAVKDGLKPVLDKAHQADVIILGSPVYFGLETGMMRSFIERFWFQYHLYSQVKAPLSPKKKGTAWIYTMNVPENMMDLYGLKAHIDQNKMWMEGLFDDCTVLTVTDTLQFDDYSRYDTDYFDVNAKIQRHAEVFPQDLQKAFELGKRLVS